MEAIATTCHSTFFVLQIARWRALLPPVIQLSLCYRQGDGGNCYHLSFNFLCVTDREMEAIVQSLLPQVESLQTKKIGQTHVFLDGGRGVCRTGECNLGNTSPRYCRNLILHLPGFRIISKFLTQNMLR